MRQALSSGTDHDAVLSRFVSGLSGRDARLLRQLLDGGGGAGDARGDGGTGPRAGEPGPAGDLE
jgi:hypothetical protein